MERQRTAFQSGNAQFVQQVAGQARDDAPGPLDVDREFRCGQVEPQRQCLFHRDRAQLGPGVEQEDLVFQGLDDVERRRRVRRGGEGDLELERPRCPHVVGDDRLLSRQRSRRQHDGHPVVRVVDVAQRAVAGKLAGRAADHLAGGLSLGKPDLVAHRVGRHGDDVAGVEMIVEIDEIEAQRDRVAADANQLEHLPRRGRGGELALERERSRRRVVIGDLLNFPFEAAGEKPQVEPDEEILELRITRQLATTDELAGRRGGRVAHAALGVERLGALQLRSRLAKLHARNRQRDPLEQVAEKLVEIAQQFPQIEQHLLRSHFQRQAVRVQRLGAGSRIGDQPACRQWRRGVEHRRAGNRRQKLAPLKRAHEHLHTRHHGTAPGADEDVERVADLGALRKRQGQLEGARGTVVTGNELRIPGQLS